MGDEVMLRLNYKEKVSVNAMKDVLKNVLNDRLSSTSVYVDENVNVLTKEIAQDIQSKLAALGFERYKYIVQVVLGEKREQGVRMGTKCFWDSGTDNQASDTFISDNIFCSATVFAAYMY